MRLSSIIVTF